MCLAMHMLMHTPAHTHVNSLSLSRTHTDRSVPRHLAKHACSPPSTHPHNVCPQTIAIATTPSPSTGHTHCAQTGGWISRSNYTELVCGCVVVRRYKLLCSSSGKGISLSHCSWCWAYVWQCVENVEAVGS